MSIAYEEYMDGENKLPLEDFPAVDWVNSIAEGKAKYVKIPENRSSLKDGYKKRKKEDFY